MTNQQHQQSFRFSDELFARIDAYGERLAKLTGLQVSRNDAVRSLVVRSLDAIEAEGGNLLAGAAEPKPTTAPKASKPTTAPKASKPTTAPKATKSRKAGK